MARRLDLRTKGGAINGEGALSLNYGEMMQQVLEKTMNPQGLTLDLVIRRVAARRPIDEAIAAGAETVTMTDEQWRVLVDSLGDFRFSIAHPVIAEFGMHIRNAPEIT